MAASKMSGKILDQVNSLADAVSGVTSYQGRHRFQEADDPEGALRAATAESQADVCWYVEERTAPAQSTMGSGTITIHGTVYMRLDTQTNSDTDNACDLMDSIFEAVMQETSYADIAARPTQGRWGRDTDDLENNIACFFIEVIFETGPVC